MWKPEPMQYLTIFTMESNLPEVALELARQGSFSPTPQADAEARTQLPQRPGQRYRELYFSALERYQKILAFYHGETLPNAESRPVTEASLTQLDDWLGEVWLECSAQQEKRRSLEEERKRLQYLLTLLEQFSTLGLDLARLAPRPGRFLDVEIGSLPSANAARLGDALALAGYLLQVFHYGADVSHAVVVGPAGQRAQIHGLLRAAAWQRLDLPEELLAPPQAARHSLATKAQAVITELAHLQQWAEATARAHQARLTEAGLALAHARPFALLAGEALIGHGSLASMTGWAPQRDVAELQRHLATALPGRATITVRAPRLGEQARVPSVLRYPAWLKPFAPLLWNYGVPRYGEVDPILPFALSFILMFGAMFGDVGQGLVIALAGALLRRRHPAGGGIGLAAGLSSMIFGGLYGSVFGVEHLIPPLWMSPMQDPVLMLVLSVGWGVGFIVLSASLRIYNRVVDGQLNEALCDSSGMAGVAFYLAAILALYGWLSGSAWTPLAFLAALLALAVVSAYKWHTQTNRGMERLIVTVIESLETATGYFANTLSFMRVAAFSLNHVALALAVYTLARELGGVGHALTLGLGNVFILVLEGGIVAIQVLRLEYYESFSRFYGGDGLPFRPLTLEPPMLRAA